MADVPVPNILSTPNARRAFTMHDRTWDQGGQSNRYVYPVVSRRSKGISIGINLNPDKACNFDCIYCSVDRTIAPTTKDVDLPILRAELAQMLDLVRTGELYRFDPFDKIPQPLRRINDIAFSGDGEPTTSPQFPAACQIAAELVASHWPLSGGGAEHSPKLVLITNATMFHRPAVQEALAFLDRHNGEIWAKLDAGTPEYYDLVDRTPVPFQRVLDNLADCCRARPTVIQSLFMRVHDQPPPESEVLAYVARLKEIVSRGGQIKLVQIYTVARRTTESFATPLAEPELESLAAHVRWALRVPVEI